MSDIALAQPLSLDDRKAFQANVKSIVGEAEAARIDRSRAWQIMGIGGLGMGFFGAAIGCVGVWWAMQTHIENHYFKEEPNGVIEESPVGRNAPKLFSEQTNEHWVKEYLKDYYTWQWETDHGRYNAVKNMSSDDQLVRYVQWHDKDPIAPRQKLERKGRVDFDDGHVTLTKKGQDKDGDFVYAVQFRLSEIDGLNVGPWKTWSGEIAFKWIPDRVMTEAQRQDNPGGFTVIYEHASQD